MTTKLTDNDLTLLYSAGFEPGWSGTSWFKKDKDGGEWQAWVNEHNRQLVFIPPSRLGITMTREEFDGRFM